MTPDLGIEPRPQGWEASAITTAPFPLLLNHAHSHMNTENKNCFGIYIFAINSIFHFLSLSRTIII